MKRLVHFAEALAAEAKGALTPEAKRALCENANRHIFNGAMGYAGNLYCK